MMDGRDPAYERLDTRYHDFEHTLQGVLCLARLLKGWSQARTRPAPDERAMRLGLLGMLLHDTGYLKPRGDCDGTGAKYTLVHVERSAEFAGRILRAEALPASDIREVQNMIRCTGMEVRIGELRFARPVDRKMGCALASADLLGQMAADDYAEKLPDLFAEFAEARERNPGSDNGACRFRNVRELMLHTPEFWESHVRPRLEHDLEGMYRFLNDPWPDGPNEYTARIEANMERIRRRVAVPA